MITPFPFHGKSPTVAAQARRSTITWWLWFLGLLGLTTLIGLLFLRSSTPTPAMIGWLFLLAGAAAILYQPRYGVYLVTGLALAGDSLLAPWYPFVKNLSSGESLLYLSNAAIVSPAEIFIALTFLSWLGRAAMQRKLTFHTGPLFWPVLTFSGFITFGLIYGILRRGNINIALWEVRAIYYLPMMLILTTNLIETRAQINCLIWVTVGALFIDALAGAWFVMFVLNFDLQLLEAIAEHSYSVHLNTLFILMIGVWLFRGSLAKQILLPLMMPTVLLSYFSNQRRASYITLVIVLLLITIVLYRESRKVFWLIVPVLGVIGAIYVGAFWNSTSGGISGPARAIRSIISPQPGGRDESSNVYRVIENVNTKFTIQQRPLTGVGFGNKFYIIVPMPDISLFVWWEYITHNSILWIWMQTGVGGFVSLLFLIGMAVLVGVRALWRMPGGDLSAFALMATLYIVMHFIYAYVDMSWEAQSMIYVGTMMGLINSLEHIVAKPMPRLPRRWPWQPEAAAAPELQPLYVNAPNR
jgi:O-antigen ligase